MSESPLSNVGSSGADIVDDVIQQKWDDFAMPDRSDDVEPDPANAVPTLEAL